MFNLVIFTTSIEDSLFIVNFLLLDFQNVFFQVVLVISLSLFSDTMTNNDTSHVCHVCHVGLIIMSCDIIIISEMLNVLILVHKKPTNALL